MKIAIITVCAVIGASSLRGAYLPPDPLESLRSDIEANADPTDAFAQVKARVAAREAAREAARLAMPVATQRMERVRGEMLAGISTDAKGNKTAKIVRADGTVEMRPLKVLHTARVQLAKDKPKNKELPIDSGHAAAAVAGAALYAAASAAAKRKPISAPGGAEPGP